MIYHVLIVIIIFVHLDVHLPELSAISCAPSTSSQSTMFASQSNSSSLGHDIGNRSECITFVFLVSFKYKVLNS